MKAVFLTPHYWGSRRKGTMHWLADALRRQGWDILFMTVGISWPVWIRREDWRLEYPVRQEGNKLAPKENGVTSFVWGTPFHPAKLPLGLLDRLATPVYRRCPHFDLRPAEAAISNAQLLVFKSSVGLLHALGHKLLMAGFWRTGTLSLLEAVRVDPRLVRAWLALLASFADPRGYRRIAAVWERLALRPAESSAEDDGLRRGV